MENNDNLHEELSSFRQQWHQELQQHLQQQPPHSQLAEESMLSPCPPERCQTPPNAKAAENEDIENKAKVLFLMGVSLERKGRIPEAIRYYRQAIQLLPDIESRISDFNELPQRQEPSQEFNEELREEDEDDDETNNYCITNISTDLECIVQQLDKLAIDGICEAEFPTNRTHISALPAELLMYIIKWVVSSRLDLRSLEQLARLNKHLPLSKAPSIFDKVSKGFYALARDPEIWRLACVRMWGVGSPVSWNGSWRKMFLERAHLLYNGAYISKISYVRPSVPTFEQQYTPYQLVIYYRYFRFFMDGTVLFHTSADDPNMSISRLSLKTETSPHVSYGNFKLVGNKSDEGTKVCAKRPSAGLFCRKDQPNEVVIVTQKPESSTAARRRGRRPVQQNSERFFHMELQLQNTKKRKNSRLTWIQYTCQTFHRATGQTTISQFDLNHQFKPFYFSRVKSFEMSTSAPLGLGRL